VAWSKDLVVPLGALKPAAPFEIFPVINFQPVYARRRRHRLNIRLPLVSVGEKTRRTRVAKQSFSFLENGNLVKWFGAFAFPILSNFFPSRFKPSVDVVSHLLFVCSIILCKADAC
jgi:hypothetical protein